MALNKNHPFEDIDGVRYSIVEKNVSEARMQFLKALLEFNRYEVIAVAEPPPKPKPAPDAVPPAASDLPPTYTLGVTDVTFNATNAIFGRQLKTPDGHIVTRAYWLQQESISEDQVPYYEK